jgi:diaminopimelate epimerase
MKIETLAGIKQLDCQVESGEVTSVTVDMGAPELDCDKIPMKCRGQFISEQLDVDGRYITGTAISMGNPHFVILDPLSRGRLDWPRIERHPMFPEDQRGVRRGAPDHIDVRVYEQGRNGPFAARALMLPQWRPY